MRGEWRQERHTRSLSRMVRRAAEQVASLWSSIRRAQGWDVLQALAEKVPDVLGARRCVLCLDEPGPDGTARRRVSRSGCSCPQEALPSPGADAAGEFAVPPVVCEGALTGDSIRPPLESDQATPTASGEAARGYLCLCNLNQGDEAGRESTEYKVSLLRDTLLSHAILFSKYRAAAMTDPLTGLASRPVFVDKLAQQCAQAARHRRRFALVMVDIDRFKTINDTFGHAVGDEVLAEVGRVLRSECRRDDTVARYGGDEFVILMPETDADRAGRLLNRIRTRLAEGAVSGRPSITLSAGLVEAEAGAAGPGGTLIRRGDMALYEAKESGRDRVVTWSGVVEATQS